MAPFAPFLRRTLVVVAAGAAAASSLSATVIVAARGGAQWREAALVVIGGALLASLAASVAAAVAAAAGARLAEGALLRLGACVGLVPLSSLGWIGLAAAAAVLAAWSLGSWRRAAPAPLAAAALAAAGPLALAVLALLPPSGSIPSPVPSGVAAAERPARPDILLVCVDTLRADALADATLALPSLSALRARAAWAPFALSSSSSTRPAHYTLFSGRSAVEHGVAGNEYRLPLGIPLLAERLRAGGYRTAAVVSNALLRRGSGFERGFEFFDEGPIVRRGPREEFLEEVWGRSWLGWLCGAQAPPALLRLLFGGGHSVTHGDRGNGRHTTDSALRLLRALQPGGQPFFLFVHYMDPHAPYWPPAETAGQRCGPLEVPPDIGAGLELGEHRMLRRLAGALERGDERALGLLAGMRRLYEEEILFVDRMVGELLAQADAGGRQPVVLFTADHGEQFGEHGLVVHSNSLYEALVRVPFLLAGPGIQPRQLAAPPHLEDVAPTLLALAGLPRDDLPGRDLLAGDPGERPHVERRLDFLAVRDGRWKLHCALQDGPGGLEPVARELYDLAEDPGELRDLVAAEPGVARRLLALAEAALSEARAAELETGARHRAALQELGYVDAEDGG